MSKPDFILKREESVELQRISPEYRGLLKEYCSAMKRHFAQNLVSICIFGSLARGKPELSSDIDVMVVVQNLPQDAGERTRSTNYLHGILKKTDASVALRNMGRSSLISDIFLTPREVEKHPPILIDMVEDAIILYDRMDFLKNVLKRLREKLKEMGARKVFTEKGYLWILKPNAKPSEVVEI